VLQVSRQGWRFEGSKFAKSAKGDVEVDRAKSVHVKNVPFSATEEDVGAFFSRAGEVVCS
jgi:RNA recognition motif-containing protein